MSADEPLRWEDVEVGDTFDCGSVEVTRDEMLEYAKRYDPQPIHVDEEAAEASIYGGLIASGWLTAALTARKLVQGYMNRTASLGGRGMDELRWHEPVRAGDVLSVTAEVVDKEPGENPAYGHVRSRIETENQEGVTVLTMYGLGLVERRDEG